MRLKTVTARKIYLQDHLPDALDNNKIYESNYVTLAYFQRPRTCCTDFHLLSSILILPVYLSRIRKALKLRQMRWQGRMDLPSSQSALMMFVQQSITSHRRQAANMKYRRVWLLRR